MQTIVLIESKELPLVPGKMLGDKVPSGNNVIVAEQHKSTPGFPYSEVSCCRQSFLLLTKVADWYDCSLAPFGGVRIRAVGRTVIDDQDFHDLALRRLTSIGPEGLP